MESRSYDSILKMLDEIAAAHVKLGIPPDREEMNEARKIVERIEAILIERGE